MTNVQRCVESLEVKLTELDKVRAGSRLADLCAKKDAAVAAKQSAMSHHAAAIKEIDEAIQQATGVLIRGYERRPVDCEWRFHEPREGWKTLYRLDTGDPVSNAEMSWAERQGSLFPEAKAWPVRQPDGTWRFADALQRRIGFYVGFVELYALEVQPDVWLRGWEVFDDEKVWQHPIGKGDEALSLDRIGDAPDAYDSAQEAFAQAAEDVLELLDGWPSSPFVVRASKWCDLVMEGKNDEEIAEAMRWPVAVNGFWDVDEADLLMREFEDGSVAKIYVLQVSEDGWVSGYSFTVGDVTRDLAPESGWIPHGSRGEAIRDAASEARDAIRDIREKLGSAKARERFAGVDAWFVEQLDAAQEPRTWPQPNEHGVYSDADAEVLKPDKLPKGAKAFIRVLQTGPDEWIAAADCSAGTAWFQPLLRGAGDENVFPARQYAVGAVADALVADVEYRLQASTSKTDRAQLLAIGKWAKALAAEMTQAAEDAERAAVEDVIASQVSNENGNGLAEEFGALDQTAAETARQAVAAAEQHRGKAAGAADWQ
jgi:hypothetical protein